MIEEGKDKLEWYRQVDPTKLSTLKDLINAPNYKDNLGTLIKTIYEFAFLTYSGMCYLLITLIFFYITDLPCRSRSASRPHKEQLDEKAGGQDAHGDPAAGHRRRHPEEAGRAHVLPRLCHPHRPRLVPREGRRRVLIAIRLPSFNSPSEMGVRRVVINLYPLSYVRFSSARKGNDNKNDLYIEKKSEMNHVFLAKCSSPQLPCLVAS